MDKIARAYKNPFPRTFDGWEKEVRGLLRFLQNPPRLDNLSTRKWWDKVSQYNYERLEALLLNHPHLPDGYVMPDLNFIHPDQREFDFTK